MYAGGEGIGYLTASLASFGAAAMQDCVSALSRASCSMPSQPTAAQAHGSALGIFNSQLQDLRQVG